MNFHFVPLDSLEELQLRRWSRLNFVPPELRQSDWHPVVLSEMRRFDLRGREVSSLPLLENKKIRLDERHQPDLGDQKHVENMARSEFHYS